MGQGGEYFAQQQAPEDDNSQEQNKYMDQSAVLRATLNSLAMMNVANVLNTNKRKPELSEEEEKIVQDVKDILRVKKINDKQNEKY